MRDQRRSSQNRTQGDYYNNTLTNKNLQNQPYYQPRRSSDNIEEPRQPVTEQETFTPNYRKSLGMNPRWSQNGRIRFSQGPYDRGYDTNRPYVNHLVPRRSAIYHHSPIALPQPRLSQTTTTQPVLTQPQILPTRGKKLVPVIDYVPVTKYVEVEDNGVGIPFGTGKVGLTPQISHVTPVQSPFSPTVASVNQSGPTVVRQQYVQRLPAIISGDRIVEHMHPVTDSFGLNVFPRSINMTNTYLSPNILPTTLGGFAQTTSVPLSTVGVSSGYINPTYSIGTLGTLGTTLPITSSAPITTKIQTFDTTNLNTFNTLKPIATIGNLSALNTLGTVNNLSTFETLGTTTTNLNSLSTVTGNVNELNTVDTAYARTIQEPVAPTIIGESVGGIDGNIVNNSGTGIALGGQLEFQGEGEELGLPLNPVGPLGVPDNIGGTIIPESVHYEPINQTQGLEGGLVGSNYQNLITKETGINAQGNINTVFEDLDGQITYDQ